MTEVPEADFDVSSEGAQGQVEIIGWLYQYYNEEPHARVVNINGGAVKEQDIPAATQLFTTDWVVRYMVDNSLGRYYLEHEPESDLGRQLKYLVPGDLHPISEKLNLHDLTVLDNAMGSGHILVYAFDVLMSIYLEQGFSRRQAAQQIIQHNLFGFEIDKRAYQLAYFALMMKLRQYDRRALVSQLTPNLYVFENSTDLTDDLIDSLKMTTLTTASLKSVRDVFLHAKTLGAIIRISQGLDLNSLMEEVVKLDSNQPNLLIDNVTVSQIKQMVAIAKLLTDKYDIVVTNPPYLNKMNPVLKGYVKKYYKSYSGDLFSVFIWLNINMTKQGGYAGYMTPFVWMFIKTYQALRMELVKTKRISSLIQMEYSAFEEATVPINTFVLQNSHENLTGSYIKLSDFKGGMDIQKAHVLDAIAHPDVGYFYRTNQANFGKIAGSPIAYWLPVAVFKDFTKGKPMGTLVHSVKGLFTGDNSRFLRQWFEVGLQNTDFNAKDVVNSIGSRKKWFPCNKGGSFRRWYGNFDYVINWFDNGKEIRNFSWPDGRRRSSVPESQYLFTACITWSDVTSGKFAMRYRPTGSLSESVGLSAFSEDGDLLFTVLGFSNTKPLNYLMQVLNPTIHAGVGYFSKIPVILPTESIVGTVKTNIELCSTDWNCFESTWDFVEQPLLFHIAEHQLSPPLKLLH